MTKVGFHPAADVEFRAAAAYYESRASGLGKEFIEEVERQCVLLDERPSMGARYDPPTGACSCDGFRSS